MRFTSIIGIIVGFVAVIGAMIFKHISFSVFLNPAAFFVIIVGTVACVLNAFPGKDLKSLGKLVKIVFSGDSKQQNQKIQLIEEIDELTHVAHREGLLSIEEKIPGLSDNFLKKGVNLVLTGSPPDLISDILETDLQETHERHSVNASIFSQAGTYAPTLGVLGAVFGLIAAMSHIDEVTMMAEAVAAAFIATILGIFTGYVLWNPFANRLRVKSKHEMVEKRMIIEGVLSLQNGESPHITRNKMTSFLSSAEMLLLPDDIKKDVVQESSE